MPSKKKDLEISPQKKEVYTLDDSALTEVEYERLQRTRVLKKNKKDFAGKKRPAMPAKQRAKMSTKELQAEHNEIIKKFYYGVRIRNTDPKCGIMLCHYCRQTYWLWPQHEQECEETFEHNPYRQ